MRMIDTVTRYTITLTVHVSKSYAIKKKGLNKFPIFKNTICTLIDEKGFFFRKIGQSTKKYSRESEMGIFIFPLLADSFLCIRPE